MDNLDYYAKKENLKLNKTNLAIQLLSVIASIILSFQIVNYGICNIIDAPNTSQIATLITLIFVFSLPASLLLDDREGGIEFAITSVLLSCETLMSTKIIRMAVIFQLGKFDLLIAITITILLIIGVPIAILIAIIVGQHLYLPIYEEDKKL